MLSLNKIIEIIQKKLPLMDSCLYNLYITFLIQNGYLLFSEHFFLLFCFVV